MSFECLCVTCKRLNRGEFPASFVTKDGSAISFFNTRRGSARQRFSSSQAFYGEPCTARTQGGKSLQENSFAAKLEEAPGNHRLFQARAENATVQNDSDSPDVQ